jgi:hypothetical protein
MFEDTRGLLVPNEEVDRRDAWFYQTGVDG